MRSSMLLTLIIVGLGLILLMGGCNNYNKFVSMEEDVENAWGKVQTQYQRRADLIPNLVATVKGAAKHERETFEAVTNARAKATSINIDPSNATPEQMQQFQEAQAGLSQSLGRLLLVAENYPELKANASFRDLQAQLEGTENRISTERNRYNDIVTSYNKSVRKFPASFFAKILGFSQKAQFQAQEGAEDAPDVKF